LVCESSEELGRMIDKTPIPRPTPTPAGPSTVAMRAFAENLYYVVQVVFDGFRAFRARPEISYLACAYLQAFIVLLSS